MRLTLLTASAAALLAGAAGAETIGVTMQSFDNNFRTLLPHGITDRAAELDGVDVQVEDSQTDLASNSTR
jgi:ribose transport system substrate-binding protein/inositol transport system substrate-binding protein